MRTTISAVGVAAAIGALALLPGAAMAAGPQSSATDVRSVHVFQAHGRTKVDVVVAQPDTASSRASARSSNRGSVRVTVRAKDGTVLAQGRARATLPLRVRAADHVVQTYRLTLSPAEGERVDAARDVDVRAVAASHLDLDGPGGDPADTDVDQDLFDTTVSTLADDPPAWGYHVIRFSTSIACDIDNDHCSFDFLIPGYSDRPFQGDGKVTITPQPTRTVIGISADDTGSWFEGNVPNMGSNRFAINGGSIPTWGTGTPYSGGRDDGAPGYPGGPLGLSVDKQAGTGRHGWVIWGYLAFRG